MSNIKDCMSHRRTSMPFIISHVNSNSMPLSSRFTSANNFHIQWTTWFLPEISFGIPWIPPIFSQMTCCIFCTIVWRLWLWSKLFWFFLFFCIFIFFLFSIIYTLIRVLIFTSFTTLVILVGLICIIDFICIVTLILLISLICILVLISIIILILRVSLICILIIIYTITLVLRGRRISLLIAWLIPSKWLSIQNGVLCQVDTIIWKVNDRHELFKI